MIVEVCARDHCELRETETGLVPKQAMDKRYGSRLTRFQQKTLKIEKQN